MKINSLGSIKAYQKPMIYKSEKMDFPVQLIMNQPNSTREKVLCRQCSSCHGCR